MSILNHTAIPYDMAEDVQPGATPDSMFMAQQAALIASQARRIEELEAFYRAVAHAAGDLDQLPDSHAFEVVWCHSDEDGNPAPGDPFITAGQIRRVEAALAKIKEAT